MAKDLDRPRAAICTVGLCASADNGPKGISPALALLPDTICTTAGKAVDDKGFVLIGGIEQWVRIKGSSGANPIVVLVHGGPGNPTTPFADKFYHSWEKDFTIVQCLLTMPEPSRRYFDFIQAPYKEFVLVPHAGHDPNPPMVKTQLTVLKKIGECG